VSARYQIFSAALRPIPLSAPPPQTRSVGVNRRAAAGAPGPEKGAMGFYQP
jgi:hypothetical protein